MTAEFVSLGDQLSVCWVTLPYPIVGGDGAPGSRVVTIATPLRRDQTGCWR
jgi:hypothetical protein